MEIEITRDVPGLTNGIPATAGAAHVFPVGLALSLISDGYAVAVETAEAVEGESAEAPRPARRGRPAKAAEAD